MTSVYAGLTASEADKVMADRIADILYEEFEGIRKVSDEEWQQRDNRYWAQSVAGAIWCALQNRLREAPHD